MEEWSRERIFQDLQDRIRKSKIRPGKISEEDIELVTKFAKKLIEQFDGFILSVVIFGSSVRNEATKESDIDVLVIVDDTNVPLTIETSGAWSLALGKILVELNAAKKLHVNTLGISDFFDGVRHADPIIINILRDGKAIIDTNIFSTFKRLLYLGRIRPTKESIDVHVKKALYFLKLVETHLVSSVNDIYWATIDAAHALLMYYDITPPSPSHVAMVFKTKLSKKIKIPKKYIKHVDEVYKIMREVIKGKKRKVDGKLVDRLKKQTVSFINWVSKKIKF